MKVAFLNHITLTSPADAATAGWSNPRSYSPLDIFYILLLIVGLGVGLWVRFDELGSRQLAVDEYYFVQSVDLIVETGWPAFPSGGYYTRGILPQYLTAVSVLLFGKTGFAYRLPAVLWGLLSVGLAYFYGQRCVGLRAAGLLVLVLLLSSWQIEFSRFARMYTALQGVTLLFLLAIEHAYFRGQWQLRYLPHGLAMVAIGTHQLGILLLPFLFLPLAMSGDQYPRVGHRGWFAAVSVLTTGLLLIMSRLDWRNIGVMAAWPETYAGYTWRTLRLPAFPFWHVSVDPLMNLSLVIGICALTIVVGWALRGWREKRQLGPIGAADIVMAVLIVCTVLHAFVLSLLCVGILVFRYRIYWAPAQPKRHLVLLSLAGAIGLAWVCYAVMTQTWMSHADISGYSLAGAWQQTFFGWPDLYTSFVRLWMREFPWLSVVAGAGLVIQLALNLRRPIPDILLTPAAVGLYFILCLSVLNSPYTSTRYTFFFYPLIWLVIIQLLRDVWCYLSSRMKWKPQGVRIWAPIGVGLAIFALSSDWNWHHITQLTEPPASFRLGPFQAYANTWYPRLDFASPSQFLNAQFLNTPAQLPSQSRIVVLGVPPVSYYLQPDHAVYYDRAKSRFFNVSRERGQRDIWSGQRLISTPDGLRHYTRGAETVWLVRSVERHRQPFQLTEVWPDRLRGEEPVFFSADARLEVVKVRLATGPG